ncbi:Ig-like domain-containing protein [Schumannella luteola]
MSRTSFSRRAAAHYFTRAFAWVTGVLLALCAVFLTLAYFQGPKLADAQLDTQAAIEQPDQQLRLFLNQPVSDVGDDQVTVEPAVGTTVTASGDVLAIQFDAPLRYTTEYTVTVADVRSTTLPQPSTITYRFTTPSPTLYYLDRGDPVDEIVRTGLTGSDREVAYSGESIQSFATTGQVLVVASLESDTTSRLDLVSLADGAVEQLRLPAEGLVSDLALSDVGSVVAFTFTPAVRDTTDVLGGRRVLLIDLESGRDVTPVGDLGGAPLPVTDWRFVPGTTSLVVQGVEETVFLVDSAPGSVPVPLGRYTEIVSVSRDGSLLAARGALGGEFVSLADGSEEPFEPSLIEGGQPFIGQFERLANGSVIEKAALQSTDGRFVVVVAVDDGSSGRILYQTPNLAGSIEEFRVSPNGQYVAIEVVPVIDDSVSDGYAENPRSTTITTVIVDIDSGLVVRSVEGFDLAW